jgi:3-methyladenine DNA glycosylase Tag
MKNIESFNTIFEKAEEKKGGYEELITMLPTLFSDAELMRLSDALYLERLTACIFVSGFSKQVIKSKWDGFMTVFQEFDLKKLSELEDEDWEAMGEDTRIIRNKRKIQAVRDNLKMIKKNSEKHDGFGKFLVGWGAADQIGLMKLLNTEGNQIGDNTSQYFLRYVGVDGFVLSSDVCAAAIEAGVATSLKPSSQKDKKALQEAFNFWHEESKMPYTHISKILAYSQG